MSPIDQITEVQHTRDWAVWKCMVIDVTRDSIQQC